MAIYEARVVYLRDQPKRTLYWGRDSSLAEQAARAWAEANKLPLVNTEALYGLDVGNSEMRVNVVIWEESPGPRFWDWQHHLSKGRKGDSL